MVLASGFAKGERVIEEPKGFGSGAV